MADETTAHCPTCTCGRRAPLQGESQPNPVPRGTISWAEHLECHAAYAVHHPGQSAERMAERGGFGWREFVNFTGHEPKSWRAS